MVGFRDPAICQFDHASGRHGKANMRRTSARAAFERSLAVGVDSEMAVNSAPLRTCRLHAIVESVPVRWLKYIC